MGKKTVGRRIFMSNALMVFVTLAIVLVVNLILIKWYWEGIELQWQNSVEQMMEEKQLTTIIEDWTIHRNVFYVMLACDAVFCMLVLVIVSGIFTRQLIRYVTTPLHALELGTERIKKGDLETPISYCGDWEFEAVCNAFNEMQAHILMEQEKNRRYEKARIDMVAGISHDLRTPLTAVRGTIQGLIDGIATTPQKQQKFLRVAYNRTADMERLLKQLLDLSRLETGNLPLNMREISLTTFLQQYEEEKELFLQEKNEEFCVEMPQQEIVIKVDPEQLYRILDNLFDNSRKYAKREALRMTLRVSCSKKRVELSFSDNGIGISEEKLPYVFDEFYRGDESRNENNGNGLGLYIVKYLVEAMGGQIFAESKEGFTIRMIFEESEVSQGWKKENGF